MFNGNYEMFRSWDEVVTKIMYSYPELKKYYEYIKTFRYGGF